MRLIVAKDYADVSRKAANIIAAQIHLKPDCVLASITTLRTLPYLSRHLAL